MACNQSIAENVTDTPDEEFTEKIVSAWLWKTVPPVLLVVGLTGNILVMAVLRVLKFTQVVALFFFFVMSVSDSTVLIVVLLRYWLKETFEVDMRTLSEAGCKIMFFLTYFSMHLSAWALTAVTVERCIVIKFSLRARTLVTITRARVAMLIIICALCLVDGYLLFTQRIKDGSCGSFEEDGIYYFDEYIFIWIDLFMLSIIPFCIMLLCNITIVREIKANISRHEKLGPSGEVKHDHNTNGSSSITTMLLAVNVLFFVTTVPISVYFILDTFLCRTGVGEARMDLAHTVTYLLQFTNYSLNFYLYVARGRRFRAALWRMLRRSNQTDSVLETRRLTLGDVTNLAPSERRATVTEGVSLLRQNILTNTLNHLRRGTVADCDCGKVQVSTADGRNTICVSTITKL